MKTDPIVDLYVRKAGQARWTKIQPDTPRGQHLLAFFHFEPERGTSMSAQPMAGVDHDTIHDNNVIQMKRLVDQRSAIRKAWDFVWALPKAAWNWAKETFHLQGVGNKVAAGFSKVVGWARTAVNYLGSSGLLGMGLTTIATDVGRTVLEVVTAPFRWIAERVGSLWVWLENKLFDETPGKENSFRNKVANGMASVREWVERRAMWVATFYAKHLASFFALDSMAMTGARVVGLTLLAPKAIGALAMLPIGGIWLSIAQIALGVLFGLEISSNTLDMIGTFQRKPELGQAMRESAEDLAAVAGATVATPQNRDARRAANRGNGKPAPAGR